MKPMRTWAMSAVMLLAIAGCEAGFEHGADAPEKPQGHLLQAEQFGAAPSPEATPTSESPMAKIQGARARLQKDPKDVEARSILARAYIQISELEKARELVQEGLELLPDEPQFLRDMGEVALFQKDVDTAIAMRRKLIEEHPLEEDVDHVYREIFYLKLFRKIGSDDDKARAFFSAVQEGNVHDQQKQYDDAAEAYRRALKVVPDDPNVRSDLGVVLRKAGKHDEAIAALKKAIETDPDHMVARLELARTQADAGDTKAAIATLKAMKKRNTDAAKRLEVDDRVARLAKGEAFDKQMLLAMADGSGTMDPRSPRDASSSDAVMGTIQVSPEDATNITGSPVLFIYARRSPSGGGGPPLAVKRVANPKFPFQFSLAQADAMVPGTDFSGEVYVSARLDDDGNVSTRNDDDLEAMPVRAQVGGQGVTVTLGRKNKKKEPESGGAGSGVIRGTIELDPDLASKAPRGATLYVYARLRPEGGPPLAVKQVPAPKFPYEFTLSEDDAMLPGSTLSGELYLIVRLDKDGNAMSKEPGDLEAAPLKLKVGGPPVKVTIDKLRGGDSGGSPHASAGGGTHLKGTIKVDDALSKKLPGNAVLFLYAKRGPGGGPPLAVRRYTDLSFPLSFSLGPENSMIKGLKLEGKVYIQARIDADGNAMTKEPGDLVNDPVVATVGDDGIEILIDKKL